MEAITKELATQKGLLPVIPQFSELREHATVTGFESTENDKDAMTLPDLDLRKFLPSQAQARMALLKRADILERRGNFVRRLEAAMEEGRKEDDIAICRTSFRLTKAFLCPAFIRLRQACDMFPNSWITFLMNSMVWMVFSIEPCHRLLLLTKRNKMKASERWILI
jgi:hypothetical protein